MNFPFYIARRYLLSKKSHNVINIISGISVAGITLGTMALVIVLSVFNGFQSLVTSLFSSFNPDFQVVASAGKTFIPDSAAMLRIHRIPGVKGVSEVIEENALMRYKDKQYIVTLKGVSPGYRKLSGLDTMMAEGDFVLDKGGQETTVLGYMVAYYLDARLNDVMNPIEVYIPSRKGSTGAGLDQAFREETIFPSGFFSIQQDFDVKYAFVPISFMRRMLDYNKDVTSLEVRVSGNADQARISEEMKRILGPGFIIRDRFQQEALIYKIFKTEKWAAFMILTFILVVATFNVIGSLSMLILDKRKDIAVLQSLGASRRNISRIFMTEGMMITLIGAVAGMVLGGVICYIQQRFGLIKLGSPDSTFVVDAYPVEMHVMDFVRVFLIVNLISFLTAWYPVHNIKKMDTSLIRTE